MAASVAKRDTDGARKGHDKPSRQQVKPDRSSRKRHRSAQNEAEDEDTTEHLRKSRRIQEISDQQRPQNPIESFKTSRKSPRLQEKQAASQQGTARGEQTRSLQKPVVKQYNRRKEKDNPPVASPADLGAHKSSQLSTSLQRIILLIQTAKRRSCANTEDEFDLPAKRPRHRLAQRTETRTGPDKENLVENWLEDSIWSRRASTENEHRLPETSINMPRKAPAVLPSPDNSFEGSISTSRKSEKSAASVHDTDYRQTLRYRNIYVEREKAPVELMRRAHRIISRSRTSPEMDDAAIQELKDTSRELQDEAEEEIIQQLAPQIIPSMKKIPDQRLARNADQLWCNSVPVPLDSSILTNPLPLPKPKPDLAFGYSEAAFTRNQLGTIDLLVDDQFGRSYAVPDQKVRFPFLEIEFKSQAKNGTHYIATNQAAGAGAIALNGYMDLMQRSYGMKKFDYEEPVYFSISMDHELARINVHYLRAPAEGGQHSFHVEGLSQHLLRDTNGIRALSRAIKNILDNGADARLRTLCEALDAYRETVIRNRNAANAQRERQHGDLPESQAGQRTRRGARAPEAQLAEGASHMEEVRISRVEPAPALPSGQRARRGGPAPEVQAGVVASYEEVRTSRPPLEPVRPVHNEQQSRRGIPAPEVQVASYGEVRTSRQPIEPVRPMHTEQRPRRAVTTTRRPARNPVDIPVKSTRMSSKRGSRVMEYD
ncbi:hypothetical protein LTR06_011037 [Exophiala xenobiotica]|nr:hypothetical protein LTR06_011037 [Exophiala xenobiotica]